jgi:hypothetical protein
MNPREFFLRAAILGEKFSPGHFSHLFNFDLKISSDIMILPENISLLSRSSLKNSSG